MNKKYLGRHTYKIYPGRNLHKKIKNGTQFTATRSGLVIDYMEIRI